MNYEELTFGKTFVPYFVGIFSKSCHLVYNILCWENISKFYGAQIKYTGTAKRKQTSTKNTSVNYQHLKLFCILQKTQVTISVMQEDREPGIEHGYSQLQNIWLSICYQVPKNGYLSVIQTGVNNRNKGFFF